MGNIVLLDDSTINKIAAGEVIERPASVVKEMIENSIDAGAKNITVEIKNGGISLIKITDDGSGIAADDMEIAFERHATSKIRKAEDLATVTSMGFRGEALASIAAIARVNMTSKTADEETGHEITVEGGKTLEFSETVRSVGTTITVQNLFYNTPVRYKFLKKDYTEAGYIEDIVARTAMVNKDVAFKLISNGKTIIQTNGNGDLASIVYSIYGKDTAAELINVDYEYDGIRVEGVIGKPVIARANRSNQVFFVNGRYIKDKNLSSAADQAYKGMIPVGRYGFIILNLIMDPKAVDVNVHPAKLEVRFEEEGKVFKAVYHAIKNNMAKSELVENVQKNEEDDEDEGTREPIEINKIFAKVTPSDSEDSEEESDEESENEEKKGGLSGLFHRILGEPEETQEEINNNRLEEIFKYRQSLKNNSYTSSDNIPKSDSSISDNVNEIKTINDEEINKKIELGNTIISSNTKEIDVNVVNDFIKDATTVVDPLKAQEIQETQAINIQKEIPVASSNTQIIDTELVRENKVQNTVEIDSEGISSLPQNTMVIDMAEKEIENEVANDNKEFASIAEGLIKAKLTSDNTQSIDTNKVREELNKQREENDEEFESNPEFDQMYKKTFGVDPFSVRREKEIENIANKKLDASNEFSYVNENVNMFEENEETKPIKYRFIGIVFDTYIVLEIKDEMYILDQHAAHERILYEKVKENYYSNEENNAQYLLLPDVITLSHKEMAVAKENIDMFEKAGFFFEDFGENTIKLTAVPSMCEDMNTKQLFLDILDEIDSIAVTARQEKEDKFIATVACKAAVKANMKLDEQEVDSLMEKLLQLPNPFTCPHGRPTAIKMTKLDLDKKFDRR